MTKEDGVAAGARAHRLAASQAAKLAHFATRAVGRLVVRGCGADLVAEHDVRKCVDDLDLCARASRKLVEQRESVGIAV
jgi:hypothetical protein